MILFKPRVDKVIFALTTGGLCVIIPFYKAIQAAHRTEEIVISFHKSMKEEESRCVAVVKAFELVEKKS